jgi:hypothetical protein
LVTQGQPAAPPTGRRSPSRPRQHSRPLTQETSLKQLLP